MEHLGTLMLVLGGGLFFGLATFWICEEKSLKDADFSDMKRICTKELDPKECMNEFNTIKYMAIYAVVMLIFDLIIYKMVFVPNGFGMMEKLAYTFIPSLVGSWIILLIKWTYQPIIKLISSFLYGAGYMGAAIVSMAIAFAF